MSDVFPKWTNKLPVILILCLGLVGSGVAAGIYYYFTPKYTRVGYQPVQPIAFSHAIHAGQLGLDCRYCHSDVDEAAHANVPANSTCVRCHKTGGILANDPKLALVRESEKTGQSIPWVRIHQVPDYVYFNHAVHVNRGISCVKCHGRIDQMEEVYHAKHLSMTFCLDCHRNPEKNIRPLAEVFNLGWEPPGATQKEKEKNQLELGHKLVEEWNVNASVGCYTCHR